MTQGDWCPVCGARPAGETCAKCGIRIDTAEAKRLREIATEVGVLVARRAELEGERSALMATASPARFGVRPRALPERPYFPPPPGYGASRRKSPGEFDASSVRNLLLALGALLLGLAAVIFVVIAWPRLTAAGQALVLLGVTVTAVGSTAALARRLPATAEALSSVSVVLVLVDCYALRETGIGTAIAESVYWAAATGLTAVGAVVFGRRLQAPAAAAAVLGPVSAIFAADAVVSGLTGWAGALAVIATGSGVLALRLDRVVLARRAPIMALAASAALIWLVGLGLAGRSAILSSGWGEALVLLAFGLAPALLAVAGPARGQFADSRVVAALIASSILQVAIADATAAFGAGTWLPAVVAGVGAVVGGTAVATLEPRRLAVALSGAGFLVGSVLYLADSWWQAVAGPLGWLDHAWSLGVNAVGQLPADVEAVKRPAETVVVLAMAVGAAVAAANSARLGSVRVGAAAAAGALLGALASVATVSLQVPLSVASGLGAIAAAALVLASWADAHDRRRLMAAALGLSIITLLPAVGWASTNRSLTVGTSLIFALAGGLSAWLGRTPWLRLGAAVLSVLAVWALLAASRVDWLEAYTLSAAAVALAARLVAKRGDPALSSWSAFGPALLVGFLPSVLAALSGAGWVRPVLLAAAALGVIVLGARLRSQAPLVAGAAVLLTLGIDALAPVAAQIPRWISVGTAGFLLLWLGATAERRMADLRRLRAGFNAFEATPDPDPRRTR